ncbi:uncharacterized protein LOC119169860 [Rhipicephalus microplus]|uniref:uncharacterized protein LOC119169860 n=1 Tax=Rhipicephalus microplus TaxID=6941 RepID=UPI003F6C0C49
MTRAEVLSRMQRYAAGFRQNGVVAGDKICTYLKNSIENLLALYGCIMAGATVVLAKASLTESELRYQIKDSDSTHVLTDLELIQEVSRAVHSLPLKGLFCMGHATGFVSAAEFLKLDENEYEELAMADPKSTVFAVCYTSGTTGMPKGTEVTHYSFVACFYSTKSITPFGNQDVLLAVNPITHLSGMLYAMIILLDGGINVIFPANSSTTETMDAIDKYKVTGIPLFPSRLQALVHEMRRSGRRLPSMKRIAVSGGLLSASAADDAWEAFDGLECLISVYGMTESCSIITAQPKTSGARSGADSGFPNTTAMLKVVDFATGEKLGPRQIGEIRFQIEGAARGYYKRPKETTELFDEEGWCKSGDAGYYDEDGRLFIVERVKQLIKCMDNQVAPAELEELLLREHSTDIAEISVVGLSHSEYGEAPAAAVVLTHEGRNKNQKLLAKAIEATVKGHLAAHKHLHGGVFFVDSLPKTDTAKVNKPMLLRLITQEQMFSS